MERVFEPKELSIGTILLVDDNEIDLLVAKKLLAKAGFTGQMDSVSSAQNALDYLQCCSVTGKYPFLILLDMSMPLLSGFDFLEMTEQRDYLKGHSFKIILLTSSVDPADQKKAQQYGAYYLEKPLNVEKLKSILR